MAPRRLTTRPKDATRRDVRRVFREARDIARKDAGPRGELDRALQVSWLLCLKVLDALQHSAEVLGNDSGIGIQYSYRWRDWAAGHNGLTGTELLAFVESAYPRRSDHLQVLLPYLRSLPTDEGCVFDGTIRTVFSFAYNLVFSGQILREVVDCIEEIEFGSVAQLWEVADAYDEMVREACYAVDSQGGFFTPRPLVRFIVQQLNPQVGERVLDPVCGTAGFLTETLRHINGGNDVSLAQNINGLRNASNSPHGTELAPLPYLLGGINLILHGAHAVRLINNDVLAFSVTDSEGTLSESPHIYDVVVCHPPLTPEIAAHSRVEQHANSISWQFLDTIIHRLRNGGRAAVILPTAALRCVEDSHDTWHMFIHKCNLRTVVALDEGVYQPYSPEAVCILFFERGLPTKETWIYRIRSHSGRIKFTKTRPIQDADFAKCIDWWELRSESVEATQLPAAQLSRYVRETLR